ncbi:bifunctional 5,10-methylenetetrahydrofolate dehydrogenase/5,10-methenyltetrahydrofolate cyclohydrolase [Amycolatopsis sp. K13G38]|uniref:Bifunctional protein FolD n=1 Tax=Amycolatopsis acididurans TaxID=2724524 RepID=A0ABX1IXQ2_9PSEU|nr:bifunctional 5,10-methylenetetrahydrofolate dehydrogenase/5,10-methenyltetrahydrofolate cyclohydrolase [Amycolatopsis acididurans]NKQ52262.1 bifunctional 5,10-methylenetetrahydrofolate dehydrogenase/5,10-methenyltetrahydrofolate cyclohydrolase [Amycolatopsis acididurans]
MTAELMDGRVVAKSVRAETARRATAFRERTGTAPGLATVLVGEDPASKVYVANKRKSATAAGIADFHRQLPETSGEEEIAEVLETLAADPAVSGILLQLPLPGGADPGDLIELIPATKDVDGLTTASQGLLARNQPGLRPCTPSGVVRLLQEPGIPLTGAEAVVVGRSELVGRPMAQLLLHEDATVTMAHSRTRNLADVTRRADVLIAAAGVPGLIGPQHVKEGATVVDVGIHRTAAGLVGDVRTTEVAGRASRLTPVPGGVGPMTIAMLLANTVTAAEMQYPDSTAEGR